MSEETHRINAIFAHGTYVTLETLAKKRGVSKAEVLRDAIALAEWFRAAQENGDRILVERDGEIREVIPRA